MQIIFSENFINNQFAVKTGGKIISKERNIQTRGKLRVISTGSGMDFARKVVKHIEKLQEESGISRDYSTLIETKEVEFGDTEIKTEILDSVRGSDLFIFCDAVNSVYPHPDYPFSIDQNLRALKTAASASSAANHITAILPYFPYSRQDKRLAREAITAKDIAKELESVGIRQVITFDIHTLAIAGFFEKAGFDNIPASRNFIEQFKKDFDLKNLVVCSPDTGGVKRAEHYSKSLGAPLAIIHKRRNYETGKVEEVTLIGDVDGKDVLVIDDIAATCGTIENALKVLKKNNAKNVSFAVTHALLNRGKRDKFGILPKETGKDKLLEFYKNGLLDRFYCADIINHGSFYSDNKEFITPIYLDRFLAEVIHSINIGEPIGKLIDRK